jgi:hypothetical protein
MIGRTGTAQGSWISILLLQFGGCEPPHIHVAHAGRYAKFWLDPVNLASNRGFRDHELTVIRKLVEANRELFLERWNAYFSGQQ